MISAVSSRLASAYGWRDPEAVTVCAHAGSCPHGLCPAPGWVGSSDAQEQEHMPSTQVLVSNKVLWHEESGLPGGTGRARAGPGSTRGEPGTSCRARK